MARQERERAFIRWVKASGLAPLQDKSVLEIGCGGGGSLLELLRLGFPPEKAVGNELLPERVEAARKNLPAAVRIVEGDASALSLPPQSFDVVFQSTVFSS